MLALQNAAYNTGMQGATGGQLLDLYPPDLSLSTLRRVVQMKTSSLFELSFVLGWLYGGGDLALLPDVKRAAAHYGLVFQIADDLEDLEQDKKNGRTVNFALALGKECAEKLLSEEQVTLCSCLKILGLDDLLQIPSLTKMLVKIK
jgi:geranylgeranyl diphosphate synthase type II